MASYSRFKQGQLYYIDWSGHREYFKILEVVEYLRPDINRVHVKAFPDSTKYDYINPGSYIGSRMRRVPERIAELIEAVYL